MPKKRVAVRPSPEEETQSIIKVRAHVRMRIKKLREVIDDPDEESSLIHFGAMSELETLLDWINQQHKLNGAGLLSAGEKEALRAMSDEATQPHLL